MRKPETDSSRSESDSMLTTWQRTILTSRLDDYKADPEQGENWESVITELSGQLTEAQSHRIRWD